MTPLLAFTLIGIAVNTLPKAVAQVKAELAEARDPASPHGAVVGADEVIGIAYRLGGLLAEAFTPAIARAHGVTLPPAVAPPVPGTSRPRPDLEATNPPVSG